MRRASGLIAALLSLCTALPALAQDSTLVRPQRPFEIWGGLAKNSPQWGWLGETPEMNLAMLALRFSRPLGDPSSSRFTTYHVDLVPIAVMSPPYESAHGDPSFNCRPGVLCVFARDLGRGLFPRGSAVGVGITPLGLTTHFRHRSKISPSIGVTAGAMYFDRRVPTTRAARFNFTAALELGLRFRRSDAHGYLLSYRLHHISNATTAPENPGVASHLLTVGLSPSWMP